MDSGDRDDEFLSDLNEKSKKELEQIFDLKYFASNFPYAFLGHGTTFYWIAKTIHRLSQSKKYEENATIKDKLLFLGVKSSAVKVHDAKVFIVEDELNLNDPNFDRIIANHLVQLVFKCQKAGTLV